MFNLSRSISFRLRSDFANSLKIVVRNKIDEGFTENEINDFD